MRRLALMALLVTVPALAQESRMASDFEIAQMKEQVARSKDSTALLSARLNLGDLYTTRNESEAAFAEYAKAYEVASAERLAARRQSEMTRYATATAYAGLAQAKLGRDGEAFRLLEESIRYTADSAKSWNLYASAMTILDKPAKAVSAARNAVSIAAADLERSPTLSNRLDLAVYQYSLATSLIETDEDADAERLLRDVGERLRSREFESLRQRIVRSESFTIYSSARGEEAAYLSLLNRSQLRLAALLERADRKAEARPVYERVLETRTDDPAALAALARLASNAEERERYFAAAFDANPFSLLLIRDYQHHLGASAPKEVDDSTTGGHVRRALVQSARGETHAARATLDALLARYPGNEALRQLRAETAEADTELGKLLIRLSRDQLSADERRQLDARTFTGTVVFDARSGAGETIFESGQIDGVRFRFSEPTAFRGDFRPRVPLLMTYRILGATEVGGADALLLEPLRLQVRR